MAFIFRPLSLLQKQIKMFLLIPNETEAKPRTFLTLGGISRTVKKSVLKSQKRRRKKLQRNRIPENIPENNKFPIAECGSRGDWESVGFLVCMHRIGSPMDHIWVPYGSHMDPMRSRTKPKPSRNDPERKRSRAETIPNKTEVELKQS